MKPQSKGKIFLAEERNCNETDWYRSYNTFNDKKHFKEHKSSFNDLSVLNDNTIAGGRSLHMPVEENSVMLLLPVVGAVSYKNTRDGENIINAGQLLISYQHKGDTIEISNPYDDLINFLQFRIKADLRKTDNKPLVFDFDLNKKRNELIEIIPAAIAKADNTEFSPIVALGKFAGREEAVYKLKNTRSSVFVFIIEGVFEVQGRLLETKDGLGLWEVSEDIELEALSNDAIVLLIELTNI